jgi:hypothetical protein
MRAWSLAVALAGAACALWQPQAAKGGAIVVFVSGDVAGHLSPCGCTKPMVGGIRRAATAVRQLGKKGGTVLLDNGPLAGGIGRQDEIKAETMAQSLATMGVTAINFAPEDAKRGQGAVLSVSRLSNGRLISSSLEPSATNPVRENIAEGPFLVGGAAMQPSRLATPLMEQSVPTDRAVAKLIDEASARGLAPVLLLQGSRDDAAALAARYPALKLIVYRATGDPPAAADRAGRTMLVTPGEKGKHLVRLTYENGEFSTYAPVSLGPGFADDPDVSRIYNDYLARVTSEKLLDRVPRTKTAAYAGSQACAKCHAKADKIWRASGHAHALATLEKEKHDRDPDCVGCHVVGLQSEQGFRTRTSTPHLANVGCESCHGPAASHAKQPKKARLPKVGEAACVKCHTTEQSPNFDFRSFWQRIAH